MMFSFNRSVIVVLGLGIVALFGTGCETFKAAGEGIARTAESAVNVTSRAFTADARNASADEANQNPEEPINAWVLADSGRLLPTHADGFVFLKAHGVWTNAESKQKEADALQPGDPNVVTYGTQARDLRRQAWTTELELTSAALQQAVDQKASAEAVRDQAVREGLSTTTQDKKIANLEAVRVFLQRHRDIVQEKLNG